MKFIRNKLLAACTLAVASALSLQAQAAISIDVADIEYDSSNPTRTLPVDYHFINNMADADSIAFSNVDVASNLVEVSFFEYHRCPDTFSSTQVTAVPATTGINTVTRWAGVNSGIPSTVATNERILLDAGERKYYVLVRGTVSDGLTVRVGQAARRLLGY